MHAGVLVADIAGLERLIEPEVNRLGYDLVRVMMIGARPTRRSR
jgi:hypothetical protein